MNYSELLQLAKGWSNLVSNRIIIWRLRRTAGKSRILEILFDMCIYTCIMQIRAENQNLVSALSITINKILCQFFEFTQNLKRSHLYSGLPLIWAAPSSKIITGLLLIYTHSIYQVYFAYSFSCLTTIHGPVNMS